MLPAWEFFAPEMMRTVERRSFTYRANASQTRIAMATLGNEGFCQVWDRDTGEQRGSFRLENKNHNNWLVFSPTGEHLVAWDGLGMVYLREGATGKIVTRLDPGGWDAGYNYGDFSPDGKTLVVNRGGFIFFWKYRDTISDSTIGGWVFFVFRLSRLYPLHLATLLLVALLQPLYHRLTGVFFVAQNEFADLGAWYLIGLGLVAIGFALFLPLGLWSLIGDRLPGPLLPIGYRLRSNRS